MNKSILIFGLGIILLIGIVGAQCVIPTDEMIITEDTTFCEGEYNLSNGISIGADNVILDFNGAILNGDGLGVGVYISGYTFPYSHNATIKNGEIHNFRTGIYSHWSDNHEIRNMNLNSNVNSGISFLTSKNSIIQDNIISSNKGPFGCGIRLNQWSDNNQIISNTINSNDYCGISIFLSDYNNITNNILDLNEGYGIRLHTSSNNIIQNINIDCSSNNCVNCGCVHLFSKSDNNTIYNNSISNNFGSDGAISIEYSNSNEINNNMLINNYQGILLRDSDFNNLTNNSIHLSSNSAIALAGTDCESNNLIKNNISYNNRGVDLSGDSNILIKNDIYSNTVGIWTVFSLTNSTILNNNIYNNSDYNFFNYQKFDVNIKYNWWGTTNKSEIESKIYDYYDDERASKVYYIPFLCESYPTDFISDENGICIVDEDSDGIQNNEDKCLNTEEKQIVYGCSCNQILELKPGKDKSLKCSPGIIKVFTKGIGWAKDLF